MIVRTGTFNNSQTMINQIMQNQNRLQELQQQISTGNKINNIYDSPIDNSAVISLNSQLAKIESYFSTIDTTKNQLNVQDSTFSTVIDKLQRINELTVLAANGASGTTGRDAAKDEINQLINSVIDLANTQYDNQYIFSGAKIETPAYSMDENGNITYNGTPSTDPTYQRKVEISDGIKITVNAAGDTVFGSYSYDEATDTSTGEGLFKTLGDLSRLLEQDPPDYDAIRGQLEGIQNGIDHVAEVQSVYSTYVARLDMTKSTLEEIEISATEQKANIVELDIPSAISELINQNYAYQASMQTFSMLSNNSLLNYM